MKRSEGYHTAALAAISQRSTGRAFGAIAARLSIIISAAVAAQTQNAPWAIALAILVIGAAQYGLGEVLVHEASHGNLSPRRELNDALGILLSWPFFYTFEGYRRFHLPHHRLALDDPQNSIFEEYRDWRLPLSDEAVSARRMLWLIVLRPLTGVITLYHLWGVASDAYWDSDLRENSCMWLAWVLIAAAFWWFGAADILILYWLAPLFLVFASLSYWSEVGDHYRTSSLMTRSFLGPAWNRIIAGNIGCHAVHHRYPGIPWFALGEVQERFGVDVAGQTSATVVEAFRQICAGRQTLRSASPGAGGL